MKFIYDALFLVGLYLTKFWFHLRGAAVQVGYRLSPKDPRVKMYAEFMRKHR